MSLASRPPRLENARTMKTWDSYCFFLYHCFVYVEVFFCSFAGFWWWDPLWEVGWSGWDVPPLCADYHIQAYLWINLFNEGYLLVSYLSDYRAVWPLFSRSVCFCSICVLADLQYISHLIRPCPVRGWTCTDGRDAKAATETGSFSCKKNYVLHNLLIDGIYLRYCWDLAQPCRDLVWAWVWCLDLFPDRTKVSRSRISRVVLSFYCLNVSLNKFSIHTEFLLMSYFSLLKNGWVCWQQWSYILIKKWSGPYKYGPKM